MDLPAFASGSGYSDQFVQVAAEKLMTYALGRGVEYQDMPLVRSIARDAAKNGNKFSTLVLDIVKSKPFLMNMKMQRRAFNLIKKKVIKEAMQCSLTKRAIPRRTFLRGAGVTLALPLLEAMVPAATALAQTPAAAPRSRGSSAFSIRTAWRRDTGSRRKKARFPKSCPSSWSLSKKVKDQTSVITGLWSKSAEPPEGTTGSDHWVAAAFLTAIKPRKTAGSDASVGSKTIDQVIARQDRPGKSAAVAAAAVEDPNSSSSNCGEGYSCSYTNSISWRVRPR